MLFLSEACEVAAAAAAANENAPGLLTAGLATGAGPDRFPRPPDPPFRFPLPLAGAALPATGPVPGLVAAEGVVEAGFSLPPDLLLGPLRIHSGPNCIEVAMLSGFWLVLRE